MGSIRNGTDLFVRWEEFPGMMRRARNSRQRDLRFGEMELGPFVRGKRRLGQLLGCGGNLETI